MMPIKVITDSGHNAGIPASFNSLVNPLTLHNSIFTNPGRKPAQKFFREALGQTYDHWNEIRNYIFEYRPGAEAVWYFYKVGWHVRVRSHNRVVIYCIPAQGYFQVLLVLSEKAMQEALASSITEATKQILLHAAPHSEGLKFYIDVRNEEVIKDIKKLLAIKLFIKN